MFLLDAMENWAALKYGKTKHFAFVFLILFVVEISELLRVHIRKQPETNLRERQKEGELGIYVLLIR